MSNKIKVLGITTEENDSFLKSLLNNDAFETTNIFNADVEKIGEINSTGKDAIIIKSEKFEDSADEFIEKLANSEKEKIKILITGNYSVDVLTKSRQLGIEKVLSTKMTSEEIIQEIKSTLGIKDEDNEEGITNRNTKIISVFGTKGGTGKSTVSVNMAAALQGKGFKVVVVDLDLQFGDVGVFMDVPKSKTIVDLAKEGSFSTASVLGALYKHDTGVMILCAPESPELAEVVKPEHIGSVARALKGEFDYVIFDMSPIIDEYVLHALDISDTIFFVTNPEISTLKNTKVCLNVLKTLGHYDKVRLVLNKEGDSYVKKTDMEAALGKKMDLVIPRDAKGAISAINRGIPLVIVNTHSKASKAILSYVKKTDI